MNRSHEAPIRPEAADGQATTAQLRRAIDSGRTGDKVAAADPAAAPLGTDAEAGGHPPAAGEVDVAMTREAVSAAPSGGWRASTAAIVFALVAVVASLGLLAAALA